MQVNELLPDKEMVDLLQELLKSNEISVRKLAVQMLNAKLGNAQASAVEIDMLLQLIAPLKDTFAVEVSNKYSIEQHALLAFKLLAKRFQSDDRCVESLQDLLAFTLDIVNDENRKSKFPFAASAVIAITQLAASLESHAIPYLPRVVDVVLDKLSSE